MMTTAQRLRALLAQPETLMLPGCYDGLSARLLARAGHKAAFMSGFAVAGARLGLPDTGLISFAEMLDALRGCVEAAPTLCIVADGDNGYGNALNVARTVRAYASAGAAAIMIEDQLSPKSYDGATAKQILPRAEARGKIRAACTTARESGILVLARTDARAVLGFEQTLLRCRDFVEEGADIIYADALASTDEMRTLRAALPRPVMANVLVGSGITPTVQSAQELGCKLIAVPHALLAAAVLPMQQAAAASLAYSDLELPAGASFEELKALFGFVEYNHRAALYAGEMPQATPSARAHGNAS